MSRYGRSDDYYDGGGSSYRSGSYDRDRRSSRGGGGDSYYDGGGGGGSRDAYRSDNYYSSRDSYRSGGGSSSGDYYSSGGSRGGSYRGGGGGGYSSSSRPPRNKLYVGNLSSRTNERDIRDTFGRVGPVIDVVMKYDFAFVEFEDRRDMEKAIDELDRYMMHGRELLVEPARHGPRTGRDRGGGYGGSSGGSRSGGGWNRRPAGMRPARGKYRLHVLDISSATSWQDLKDWARKAGHSVVYGDVYVEDGRRIGTVEYDSMEDYDHALKNLEREKLHNRYVRVYREGELPPPTRDELDAVAAGGGGSTGLGGGGGGSSHGGPPGGGGSGSSAMGLDDRLGRKRERSHDSRGRSHSRSRSRSGGRRRDDRSYSRSGTPRSRSPRSTSPPVRRGEELDERKADLSSGGNHTHLAPIGAGDLVSNADTLAPITVAADSGVGADLPAPNEPQAE